MQSLKDHPLKVIATITIITTPVEARGMITIITAEVVEAIEAAVPVLPARGLTTGDLLQQPVKKVLIQEVAEGAKI